MQATVNPLRGKTINWRAVCGRTARTVRRGERQSQADVPTPIEPRASDSLVSTLFGLGVIRTLRVWIGPNVGLPNPVQEQADLLMNVGRRLNHQ